MSGGNGRQFVKYSFYKVDPEWRRLPDEQQADNRGEFAALVQPDRQRNGKDRRENRKPKGFESRPSGGLKRDGHRNNRS